MDETWEVLNKSQLSFLSLHYMCSYLTPKFLREKDIVFAYHMEHGGEELCENHSKITVVMVPFPAQGHLNPLLHLARLISNHSISVYYIGTAVHIRQVTSRVQAWNPSSVTNLHFHDIPTPPFENLLPDASSNLQTHLRPMLIETLTHLKEPLIQLVNKLVTEFTRVVLIFDSIMATTVHSACSVPNVESYCFRSVSALFWGSYYCQVVKKTCLPPEIEHLKELVPSMVGCFTPKLQEFMLMQERARNFHHGTIYNSNRVVESLYLDLFEGATKSWGLGPFNPVAILENIDPKTRHVCLKWLDKQPANSVIYISFGSTSSILDEQVTELAFGLETSDQKFVWVLRDADKGDIFSGEVRKFELPPGFEERVNGRGIVVRDWAPQLEILAHTATGGFMSHCGWNSCMESISMGVPIATWPMYSDQPTNAILLTKILKVGIEVKDLRCGSEVVPSFTIEKAVRRLMVSAEGDEIRKRATDLGIDVKKSVNEDGVAYVELKAFVHHITR